ncbi:hypothetical protein [Acidisphaera sp. S103]|uniref:hypothetical protein n=1 Tax=Acidisphaera sp. S103 TaxID=1747223 RepID=UPI00131E4F38|nr:hypothetical protein [Acidisphaera sp. S103]
MRQLWALFVILAVAVSVAFLERNPVPLRPFDKEISHQDSQLTSLGHPNIPSATNTAVAKSQPDVSGRPFKETQGLDDGPKWTDIIQAISAAVVAMLTVALVCINRRQTEHIRRSTKAAQKAAAMAERALSEHERPWVFLEEIKVDLRQDPGRWFNNHATRLKWKNVGRSPGLLRSFEYKFIAENQLPNEPDYCDMRQFSIDPTLPVGKEFCTQPIYTPRTAISSEQPIEYVCFGRLTYAEMSGKEHRSGFAFLLAPGGALHIHYARGTYNYYT